MADAFRSIMSKKINEAPIDTPVAPAISDATLSKYKKKTREADEKIAKEDEEQKKRIKKEQQRLLGRVIPTKSEMEHERSLQIIATKGVVQLFNAVAEF